MDLTAIHIGLANFDMSYIDLFIITPISSIVYNEPIGHPVYSYGVTQVTQKVETEGNGKLATKLPLVLGINEMCSRRFWQ